MKKYFEIISEFDTDAAVIDILPLGNGLINDTFFVKTAGHSPDYVLQRINNAIFTDIEGLQNNITAVTGHIRRKLSERGVADIDRRVLRFLPLRGSDLTFYLDPETSTYWRLSVFIPGTKTLEKVTPLTARSAGLAFGEFEAMLADINETLVETIPDFHNMELRLSQLREAVAVDKAGRLGEVRDIVESIERRADEMTLAERLHRRGELPKRVCHCDTKVNNMLVDAETGEVLCVIDLDTVMPSYVFSDYGDFLRTGACTTPEDEPDTAKIAFDSDIYSAFTEGYLQATSSFLTPVERENLPYAVRLFPYMQAVRFLTDYLNGDTYYRIAYPGHNLVRTRAQLAYLDAIDSALPSL